MICLQNGLRIFLVECTEIKPRSKGRNQNKKRPGQCTTTDQGMTPRTEATRYRRQYITSSGLWQDWRIFYDQRWTAQREQHEAGD